MKKYTTLEEMYQAEDYQAYISDKLGNDLFINDPERADRLYKAAENGSDGSTHAETIDDWQEFLGELYVYTGFDCDEDQEKADITQATYDAIQAEIDACYLWHDKNGSLYESAI